MQTTIAVVVPPPKLANPAEKTRIFMQLRKRRAWWLVRSPGDSDCRLGQSTRVDTPQPIFQIRTETQKRRDVRR
jgi:hypothetical protein